MLMIVLSVGCTGRPSADAITQAMQDDVNIEVYSDQKAGSLENTASLPASNPLHLSLKKWLLQCRMKRSCTNYVPNVQILNDLLMVNMTPKHVVISLRRKPGDVWTQYSATTDDASDGLRKDFMAYVYGP